MDVIFSAPFSGALYQWFAECLSRKGRDIYQGANAQPGDYYHHAFDGAREIADVAIASLVMFDGVFLAAGDFAAPDAMRDTFTVPPRQQRSFKTDLGVTIGPNALDQAYRLLGNSDDTRDIAQVPEVAAALEGVPVGEHSMELAGAVSDALLVGEFRVPLICGARRRRVLDALIATGVINQRLLFNDASPLAGLRNDQLDQGERYGATLGDYVALRAIRLHEPTLELVGAVKDDADVRSSAESFQSLLATPDAPRNSDELHQRLKLAASRQKAMRTVDKIVDFGAYGLAVAAMTPGLTPVIGAASLMAPLSRLATGAVVRRESWYQFDSKITAVADAVTKD